MNTESAVRDRYTDAAQNQEPALCCPVNYDRRYLEVIPQEVIDRDYGCGDPSKYVNAGETVLDLGSGGGKICFIASQVVGNQGKVIGVDMNDTMLELARRSQREVAQKIGYDNVTFHKGKIQDMVIDRDRVDAYLAENPVQDEPGLQRLEAFMTNMRQQSPMIADNSIDVVVSNCVLNLVDGNEKEQLFREIFRVLKIGGRAVISDIVSDEAVPLAMQQDANLWSGCISGAFQEREFLRAFERAGFMGIHMPVLQPEPWQTVQGIEFRSATVIAYKPDPSGCFEHNEAVIYRGPYRQVTDDMGNVFERGQRTATCRKTFTMMTSEPYGDDFIAVSPLTPISADDAKQFDSSANALRSPRVTKGKNFDLTIMGQDCCGEENCC
ncbi:methyltransferase domain-containing protein [Rubripirellula amarantea]|uniref:methyltransferase domain-containing protein n=1 Tax=Rubripirellula amarantea TaxID=2527999 RepID=UPI0011B4A85E|nr:methyltransferase domain-containing protein [Rubripirellula amarantea]